MTTILRLTSASLASWLRIGITLCTQIFLLPVYLSYWDRKTYGVWLAIQAAISLTTLPDTAYSNFLGYEFLIIGGNDRRRISVVFSASVPISLAIGTIELIAVFLLVRLGAQAWLFGTNSAVDSQLMKDAGIVLLIQSMIWPIFGSVGATAGRLLSPLGYFPRMAWWGVVTTIATSLIPAIAVILGAGLLGAGIALGLATVLYCVPLYADIYRIAKREGLVFVRPDWAMGLRNLWNSSPLIAKTLLEMTRQQGIRIILSPLAGVSAMAAFATMRTGANCVLQGLNTITNPLLPELMRFLVARDQARCEASFAVVWLVVTACMAPAVIVLQWVAPHLFGLWTRGKISFDPLLFATLSDGILIYALSQPAMAVVQGNNLLRAQLVISALAGGTAILGLLAMVPAFSILGAGIALLLAEIVSVVGYVGVASKWLGTQSMRWPSPAFRTVTASVGVSGIATAAMAILPAYAGLIMAAGALIESLLAVVYWKQVPAVARSRVAQIVASMPPRMLSGRLASMLRMKDLGVRYARKRTP
jgi:O-antigen/teichoic acid export membrane protein